VTWFISRLARGIRREMKKATTYASLTIVSDVAMEVEDEYVASGDDVEVDVEVRKVHRSSIKGNTSPTQDSTSNIGVEEVREIERKLLDKIKKNYCKPLRRSCILLGKERELDVLIVWESIW